MAVRSGSPCVAVTQFPTQNPFIFTLSDISTLLVQIQSLDLSKCRPDLKKSAECVVLCDNLRADPFLEALQQKALATNMDYVYVSCGGVSCGGIVSRDTQSDMSTESTESSECYFILPNGIGFDFEDDVFEDDVFDNDVFEDPDECALREIAESVAGMVLM